MTVTLRNTSTLTASDRRFVAGLGDAELSRGEFRALLMAYRRDRVDNAGLRTVIGLDRLEASQLLRRLRDRDLLRLHSHGAASYYTLSPALRENIVGNSGGADRGETYDLIDTTSPPIDTTSPPIDTTSTPIDTTSTPDRHHLAPDRGELPADLRARIERLGTRPPRDSVRDVLEAICLARGWTSSADFSRFLHFGQRNLRRRHLSPMVEQGRLTYRHPDNPNHPEQAYRATQRERV